MRRCVALLLVMACGHSEPFTAVREGGGEGPYRDDPWPLLTVDTVADPRWTSDEQGILIRLPKRPITSPPDPPGSLRRPEREIGECLALLPAGGGSAVWQRCDPTMEAIGRVPRYPSAAIGPGGVVAYVEVRKRVGYHFPASSQIDLMATDTGLTSVPRRVMTLYRDANGQSSTPPNEANWFTDLVWLDQRSLVAYAWHLRPDTSTILLGLWVGTIAENSVQWRPLPPAGPKSTVAVAEGGRSLVLWRGDGGLARVPIEGGTVSMGQLDGVGDGRQLVSVRCDGSQCLAIVEPATGGEYAAWRIALPDLSSEPLGTFLWDRGPIYVGTRGQALGLSARRLYLRTDLVPTLP